MAYETEMTAQDVIVRTWSARATPAGADNYRDYFARVLLPELRTLPGFAGGYLLSRSHEGRVELTAHTFWESIDAIRSFAGHDITVAIVEPEARAVLLDIDATASHRAVLVDARG